MSEELQIIREFFSADTYAMDLTGITIDEVGDRSAVCSLCPQAKHANADGVVQGGAIYTLADFCFAVAANGRSIAQRGLPEKVTYTANITYLRPAKLGQKLIAAAKCIKDGRTACCYEVSISAQDDRETILATAVISGISVHR